MYQFFDLLIYWWALRLLPALGYCTLLFFYFSWLLLLASILILKVINTFFTSSTPLPSLSLSFPSLLSLSLPAISPPHPRSCGYCGKTDLHHDPLSNSLYFWIFLNGGKDYSFMSGNQHFRGRSLASKKYFQEYKAPGNKRVPSMVLLFLWFETSSATVEWQYFKQTLLDIGCFHI